MTDPRARIGNAAEPGMKQVRAQVAQEEAEAAEAEITEKALALDVPLHLRIDEELDAELRRQAADEHVRT